MLRGGLKLTAVVLHRQRGSSIPCKRRPMDQVLSSIFWMRKGQPCECVSPVFSIAPWEQLAIKHFRLHRLAGNIASEPMHIRRERPQLP
jgi:hypothetical protein